MRFNLSSGQLPVSLTFGCSQLVLRVAGGRLGFSAKFQALSSRYRAGSFLDPALGFPLEPLNRIACAWFHGANIREESSVGYGATTLKKHQPASGFKTVRRDKGLF
jgi:hypothetical protein